MNHNINITRIKAVYNALGELRDRVVFVGGAVVSLYAERNAEEVRPTEDVDVLVEIYTHQQYAELEEKLRSIGFENDTKAEFIGRFTINGVVVDIMPLAESVTGFPNKWYKEAYDNSVKYILDASTAVNIFTAPYFLATKLEAFKSRGKNQSGEYDGRFSTDFEDIVFLLVYRKSIWNEIRELQGNLKEFLIAEFSLLLKNPGLEEWIDAQTEYTSPVANNLIIPEMKKLIENK